MAKSKTKEGDINRNGQMLICKTKQPGNQYYSRIWILRCTNPKCNTKYGANGFDFHERKCPGCQKGKPGLPFKGDCTQEQSKKEILKDKVVALVKEFVQTEGGITYDDLEELFGIHGQHEVAAALGKHLRIAF